MSYAMLPTVEMEGPAGRAVVTASPEEIALWEARGYKKIRSPKGSIVEVIEQADIEAAAAEATAREAESKAKEAAEKADAIKKGKNKN